MDAVAINMDDIHEAGSLNRYMKHGVFIRNTQDPSAVNPPRFAVAGVYTTRPGREEINAAMERAEYLTAMTERDAEEQKRGGGSGFLS